ncbi:MAG: hypothetical protein ACI9RM_001092 [Ulvibacter sp.]|jgi:hypothetical protein
MMKHGLVVLITMILLIGCGKDDSQEVDCVTAKLEALNMLEYEDQEISCQFFLRLYEYNEKQYFLLDNYCADIIAYPTDCEGNKLCEAELDSDCNEFYQSAVEIGIVGISQ